MGCRLWGHTESDTTEVTEQQQQHSKGFLFILFMVSFAVQKLLILIRSHLFVFLVLNCMSCLYILEMNPLSVVSFAIIFSHSEGCLFTLFIQDAKTFKFN